MSRRLAVVLAAAPLAVAPAVPSAASDACFLPSTEIVLDRGMRLPPDYGRVDLRADSFVCSVALTFHLAACGDGGPGYGTVSWNDRTANVRVEWVGGTIVLTGEAAGELGVSYDVADCASPTGARELVLGGTVLAPRSEK